MTFGIFHYGGYSLLFYYIIGFAANLHFLTYSFIFHSPFVVLGETIQMITIQLAKDQAAQEFGYESWHDLAFMLKEYPLEKLEYSQYNLAFNRSLEIYAESKAKEAYNQGVRDAQENAKNKLHSFSDREFILSSLGILKLLK